MKRVLVLAPILPQWSELVAVEKSLGFLNNSCELSYLDPLSCMIDNIKKAHFIAYWREKLTALFEDYDVLMGFSLGGIILQKCFDIFQKDIKPIVLFSTPSFSDELLSKRLSEIVALVKGGQLSAAISKLNEYVCYPYDPPVVDALINEVDRVNERLCFGFDLVMQMDSRQALKETTVPYLHLIGENSQLVNSDNVIAPSACRLIKIPGAGMRVLQNKPELCIKPINDFLRTSI